MISRYLLFVIEDDAVKLGLEPLHGILLGQPVGKSNTSSLATPVTNVHPGPAEDNIEVHAVDTNTGVIPKKETFSPDNVLMRHASCDRIRRPAEFRDAELVL